MRDITSVLTQRIVRQALCAGSSWAPKGHIAQGSDGQELTGHPYGCLDRSWRRGAYFGVLTGAGAWEEAWYDTRALGYDRLASGEVWGLLIVS